MKENNHVHTADYIGQEHGSVLGGGREESKQVSIPMSPQQRLQGPMIQLGILLRISSTNPILRRTLYFSGSQLFWKLWLYICLFTRGKKLETI